MRILIIEDEHKIASAIKRGLEQEAYSVDVANEGTEGFDLASTEEYDLMIIDVMLPGVSGVEISKKLRSQNIHTPILILTAKSQLEDKIIGFDSGADDYLTKPFAFEELLARIKALLRRPKSITADTVKYKNIRVNTKDKTIKVNNKELKLSKKLYQLLEFLLRNRQRTLSKEQIITYVWDYESNILQNTIEQHIKLLRSKLSESKALVFIETVRGFGYRLK